MPHFSGLTVPFWRMVLVENFTVANLQWHVIFTFADQFDYLQNRWIGTFSIRAPKLNASYRLWVVRKHGILDNLIDVALRKTCRHILEDILLRQRWEIFQGLRENDSRWFTNIRFDQRVQGLPGRDPRPPGSYQWQPRWSEYFSTGTQLRRAPKCTLCRSKMETELSEYWFHSSAENRQISHGNRCTKPWMAKKFYIFHDGILLKGKTKYGMDWNYNSHCLFEKTFSFLSHVCIFLTKEVE